MTEDEHAMIKDMHEFFMEKRGPSKDQPSRAEELDRILIHINAGKLGGKLFFRICGGIVAIAATVAAVRTMGK